MVYYCLPFFTVSMTDWGEGGSPEWSDGWNGGTDDSRWERDIHQTIPAGHEPGGLLLKCVVISVYHTIPTTANFCTYVTDVLMHYTGCGQTTSGSPIQFLWCTCSSPGAEILLYYWHMHCHAADSRDMTADPLISLVVKPLTQTSFILWIRIPKPYKHWTWSGTFTCTIGHAFA